MNGMQQLIFMRNPDAGLDWELWLDDNGEMFVRDRGQWRRLETTACKSDKFGFSLEKKREEALKRGEENEQS